MIRNYFKIALRNLISGGWYSALNIGGLAVVLSVTILLFWWVKDELSFDRFHEDSDRIYAVNAHFGGVTNENTFLAAPPPLGIAASKFVPGVESMVRMTSYGAHTFRVNGKTFTENCEKTYIDEHFLDLFKGFKVIYGDAKNPFPASNSIVLTSGLAAKYFGTAGAIGKVIKNIEHNQTFVVGAVIADLPDNSSLRYKMFVPMGVKKQAYTENGAWKSMDDNWDDYDFEIYLKLSPGINPDKVAKQLTAIKNRVQRTSEDNANYQLQALTEIHLHPVEGLTSGLQQIRILALIGLMLLTIGCINYINLTTARATRRKKEVGIRKVVGAGSRQLAAQLFTESLLTLGLAVLLAIVLIHILLPFYASVTDKSGHFPLQSSDTWLILLGTVVLTFILAGIYPAMLVAKFDPITSLRGHASQAGHLNLRKALVVTQFVLTTALISGTFIIGTQLRFIRERDPGFSKEHVFTFNGRQFTDQFKRELAGESGISNISTSTDSPLRVMSATATCDWDGKPANSMLIIAYMGVDKDFISNFKMKLLEGSDFDGSRADSTHFILNETAVKQTGIKNPIGKRFNFEGTNGTIIGVVKDFNIASVRERVRPVILFSHPAKNNIVLVHTAGGSVREAVAAAEKRWKQYLPDYPFEYSFLDADYQQQYKSEEQTGKLFNFFAGIAILISCLGLLGLTSFSAEQRTKEIGIRKVLGASVMGITSMLSKDFLKPVLISVVIASPLAWFVMDLWLEDFAYKIEIKWWMFIGAGLLSVLTALLTIGFQSIKAARMNPVKSLKSEY